MATFFIIPLKHEITAKEIDARWNQHTRCWYAIDKKTAEWLREAGFRETPMPGAEITPGHIDHVHLS